MTDASLQITQKQLRASPEDELALSKIQGMKQICHLPVTAISGFKISQFNFTFLAAKGWFAIEETNWRPGGYQPQKQEELTYLDTQYSSQDLQALGWRLELIWSFADVLISFQHLVIKRTI